MSTKNILIKIVLLIMLVALAVALFAGCGEKWQVDNGRQTIETAETAENQAENQDEALWEHEYITTEEAQTSRDDFDLMMDEMFAEWVTNDALTMNYFLADPYAMGIERPDNTFGEVFSLESIEQARQDNIDLSNRLDEFVRITLRDDQKIVYDILRRSIYLSEIMNREDDFFFLTGHIRPLNGIQVQLPILLAEFNFYTVDDIEIYLELIGDTYRYFSDIIEFERERVRRGLFLNDANIDSVIEQVETFIEKREDNLLITIFNERIENYYGLTDEQRERFIRENTELVLNNIIPAYELVLDAMHEFHGVGGRSGGFANQPGGAEYGHALLRQRIGTDRSIEELEELLNSWLDETWASIWGILRDNPDLDARRMRGDVGQIDDATPMEYINALREQMYGNFPPVEGDTGLVILDVHVSLQEHVGPAFFLVPAIDRFDENVVYMNPSSINDNLFFFTVLAHESYPGHMYQNVFFRQQAPHPLRFALSNIGYSEGWATYAEMYGYIFAGIDLDEAMLMWNFRFVDIMLQSVSDFGVNLLGWDIDDVAEFLFMFGLTDRSIAESIYNRVTAVPLNSLAYSLGFIEMVGLREEAEDILGNDFVLIDFHTFFLEFGPAPFPMLSERMNGRVEATGSLS